MTDWTADQRNAIREHATNVIFEWIENNDEYPTGTVAAQAVYDTDPNGTLADYKAAHDGQGIESRRMYARTVGEAVRDEVIIPMVDELAEDHLAVKILKDLLDYGDRATWAMLGNSLLPEPDDLNDWEFPGWEDNTEDEETEQ